VKAEPGTDPGRGGEDRPAYISAVKESIVGFAVGLLLAALGAAVAEAVTGYKTRSGLPIPLAVTAANLIGLWVGLSGTALYVSRTRGTGNLGRDFGWRFGAWWDVPLGAAIGLISQYALIPLMYLPFEHADRSLSRQLSQPAHRYSDSVHSPALVLFLFALLAVGAPLVEELYFRGLLLRSLQTKLPTAVAIVLSAVIFASAHFEVVQFAGLAVFGVILGTLAWRTGRLGPSIAAHMAFNAAAVAAVAHVR
jgi:uncharacterized protein